MRYSKPHSVDRQPVEVAPAATRQRNKIKCGGQPCWGGLFWTTGKAITIKNENVSKM